MGWLSGKSMGRPPLGLKMTMVRLPERTLERIDILQGKRGRRSAFIRVAIERELQRREKDPSGQNEHAPREMRNNPRDWRIAEVEAVCRELAFSRSFPPCPAARATAVRRKRHCATYRMLLSNGSSKPGSSADPFLSRKCTRWLKQRETVD